MTRTNPKMEYNDDQKEVAAVRDVMVEEGVDPATAARYALTAMHNPSKAFVEHLSEGALTKKDGVVVERDEAPAAS